MNLNDCFFILLRRRYSFLLTVALVLSIALIAAHRLGPTYRATAVFTAAGLEVPAHEDESSIAPHVERAIASLTDRVLLEEKRSKPGMNVPEQAGMRGLSAWYARVSGKATSNDIGIEILNTEFTPSGAHNQAMVNVRFALNLDGPDAKRINERMESLAGLYLDINKLPHVSDVTTRVSELEVRANQVEMRYQHLHRELSQFDWLNRAMEFRGLDREVRAVDSAEIEWSRLEQEVTGLMATRADLMQQLEALGEAIATDSAIDTPIETAGVVDRTRALRAAYSEKAAVYVSSHPELVSLKLRVAGLETNFQALAPIQRVMDEALSGGYEGEKSPGPRAEKLYAARLQELESEIKAIDADLARVGGEKEKLLDGLTRLRAEQRESEASHNSYQALVQQYKRYQNEHRRLVQELSQAQFNHLESGSRSLYHLDLNQAPSPARSRNPHAQMMIVAIAGLVGILFGAIVISVAERLDRRIHGKNSLQRRLGVTPIGVIPCLGEA